MFQTTNQIMNYYWTIDMMIGKASTGQFLEAPLAWEMKQLKHQTYQTSSKDWPPGKEKSLHDTSSS